MDSYHRITIFENEDRTDALLRFRNNIVEYYNNCEPSQFMRDPTEGPRASELRPEINRDMAKVIRIIRASGVSTMFDVMRAPAAGGGVYSMDVVNGVFNLAYHQIDPRGVTDLIDRSIGIYEHDQRNAAIRTFNPFWWIWRGFTAVSEVPFRAFGYIGLNQSKIENSLPGRLVKLAIQLVLLFVALLQIDAFIFSSRMAGYLNSLLHI